MTKFRDYQKSRVYRWEDTHMPNGGMIDFPNVQPIVNHIWTDTGLEYPPIVELLDVRSTRLEGSATRMQIKLRGRVSMKTILHEMAHSMTSNMYGESNGHGSLFVGMYSKLLQKYLNVDLFHILTTCAVEGVDIDITARPVFLD